jgi:hypothetical protein
MSIKIGTVDPLELLDPAKLDEDTAKPDQRIHVYVRHTARPAVIELVSECCALSISDARCLVSLLNLAIRQAELRIGPGFDQPPRPDTARVCYCAAHDVPHYHADGEVRL